MPKFKKGDRVKVGAIGTMTEHIGLVGTVIDYDTCPFIEFDVPIFEGNNALDRGEEGYCYSYIETKLTLVKEKDLPYTFDDLVRAIGTLGLHDKDEFMLLNMIDMIKEA